MKRPAIDSDSFNREEFATELPAVDDHVGPESLGNEASGSVGDGGVATQDGRISIRSLMSDTVLYGIARAADPAIGFLMLPIITAILSPADYGLISLFVATSHVMFTVSSLAIHQSFLRFYLETTDPITREKYANIAFTLAILYWALVAPPLAYFATPIGVWLFEVSSPALILAMLTFSLAQTGAAIGFNLLQGAGRVWAFLWNSLLTTFLVRCIAISGVLLGAGAWGWITGETLARLIGMIVIVATAMPRLRFMFERMSTRTLSSYGMMLVPAMLSLYLMIITDKLLIRMLADNPFEQVGLYSVGERVAAIMHLANFAIVLGWQRFAFRNMHEEGGDDLIGYGLFVYAIGGGFILLGLLVLGDDLMYWVIASKFSAGFVTIIPLTMAAAAGGLADITDVGLHKRRWPHLISVLTTIAAIANVGLNIYMIPRYGIVGAAWATFLCQSLRFLMIFSASQWAFFVRIDYRRVSLVIAVYVSVFVCSLGLERLGTVAGGIAQVILMACVPVLLWCMPLFTEEERTQFRSTLASGVRRITPYLPATVRPS
ncbi:MAG: oligosaccharide flippase family protein [Planctomycetota bacterium]